MTTSVLPADASADSHRLKVRPKVGWQAVELRELWHYKELLWILALRDIKVRYKQTVLGIAWAVIQPVTQMVLFNLIFTKLGGMSTDGLPGPLFYFCGLLPLQLFTNAMSQAGNSLISNQSLISKVYFPRLVIPIASVVTGLIDFCISFGVLLLIMFWYRHDDRWHVGPQVLLLPVFVGMAFLSALAVGLWLSALNVEFRDVRYVIPFMVQVWTWATPVVWTMAMLEHGYGKWARFGAELNPLAGVVEGFRWCLLGKPSPDPMLLVSLLSIAVCLIGGAFFFRRMEKTFADLV